MSRETVQNFVSNPSRRLNHESPGPLPCGKYGSLFNNAQGVIIMH